MPAQPLGAAGPGVLAGQLPWDIAEPFRRLGGRLTSPETSRVTLAGTLRDGHGARSVQVTWQAPRLGRIEESGGPSRVLTYDGASQSSSKGTVGREEENLLQSLVLDLPEQIFQAIAGGSPVRFLAGRARVKSGLHQGAEVEVYELLRVESGRGDTSRRAAAAQLLAFDSRTLLLRSVSSAVPILPGASPGETSFLGWTAGRGGAFPSAIVRTEGGQEVFRFEITQAEAGNRLAEGLFRP